MQEEILASQLRVTVNGSLISTEQMDKLEEATVEQHAHLPGMFTLRFFDPGMELIDSGPFNLTNEIEIKGENESGSVFTLIKGEITALEPQFDEGGEVALVVRGFDKSHRLYRETRSEAYLNIKDSDLADQFAGKVGLSTQVDATTTVYDHLYQNNESDMSFLMERARRIGYECFVAEGKLYFRKPVSSSAAVTLKFGEDLLSFHPSMTLAEQVDEVVVKGWNAESQQAIIGQARSGNTYPQISESKNGAQWAGSFGAGKVVIVDQPVISQAEANSLAQARLNELSGSFVQADGVALRRPDIRAGEKVKLEKLGNRFSGAYLVTSATHIYTIEGFTTMFTVSGARTGTLTEQLTPKKDPKPRWPGVVVGLVTNTDDPNDWGRVKVQFPWMTEDAESAWARVLGAGAGPEAGLFAIPEVGDEVLVAFEQGDFNYPYVLGGLWNGQSAIPPEGASGASGERPLTRTWRSRTGHFLAMYDNADNKVEIITAGGHTILLDDANQKIEVASSSGHKIILNDQGKELSVQSSGGHKVTMSDTSQNMQVESTGNLTVKAGMNMTLEANAGMTVKTSGILTMQGSMVKIN